MQNEHGVDCPYCGKVQTATTSLAQRSGNCSCGFVLCKGCGKYFQTIYNTENGTMDAAVIPELDAKEKREAVRRRSRA